MEPQLFSAGRNAPLIGCAGWSIASAQRLHFPESGSHLSRYAAVLPAVEINSAFYRPHRPDTYRRWRDSVPEAFRFSVKMPRAITHEQRLQDAGLLLARFLQEAGELGDKLGCLLVQLPPGLPFDPRSAAAFFTSLTQQTATAVVCEARHRSWFSPEAGAILASFGVAQVLADPPVAQVPLVAQGAHTVYVRLHGSPHMYRSSYAQEFLLRLESELRRYQEAGKTVWCIFDNTAEGAAMPNALALLAQFGAETLADVKNGEGA
ncbi:DUF72 domain-containing protein [Janthinobacterium sp. 17J80-10]|uniref:DUF72 domain-containing protein n=1 Tax=Janthinobacterium sp. 17J80-10 TaxID=2497863 RepID=UPI0010054B96|nr:DUF72 domain-containing protein [Janthinobacterium sp. 17J80-10]QAU32916.1 DUF72 domain-containing protein [Janthinobacterium sp. 17J80-10]